MFIVGENTLKRERMQNYVCFYSESFSLFLFGNLLIGMLQEFRQSHQNHDAPFATKIVKM